MGITLISPPVAASAGSANSSAASTDLPLPADGIAIDFAALLSRQLTGLPLPTNGATNSKQEPLDTSKQADKPNDLLDGILAAQDPALAAQMAIPYSAPALENRQSVNVESNKGSALDIESGIDSEALNGNKNGLTPSLPLDAKALPASALTANTQTSLSTGLLPQQPETAILAGETSSGNATQPAFASLMSGHMPTQSQQIASGSNVTINTPLQNSAWAQDFNNHIVWMAKNDQQVAQINISPAQLGPVQITLNLNGDQASLSFASPHAEVRKAIEDAMPNLREMLSSTGISLGQSNVGAQLPQQQRESAAQFANGSRSTGENAILPADSRSGSTSSGLPIQRGRGFVDLFA